jgi:hypothetical protein
VLVDKQKYRFRVHEEHITSSSEFFKKAMSGNWKEKEARQVKLPDTTLRAFEIYVAWLYTSLFYITDDNDCENEDQDKNALIPDEEFNKWKECYTLADFVLDDDFKDALIDVLMDKMNTEGSYWYDVARLIYPHTGAESPHRQFAIDCAVKLWDSEDFDRFAEEECPVDFKDDLIMAMGANLRDGLDKERVKEFVGDIEPCQYHEHTAKNTPCYKTKRKFPL